MYGMPKYDLDAMDKKKSGRIVSGTMDEIKSRTFARLLIDISTTQLGFTTKLHARRRESPELLSD